jgi:hypothetical protein
MVILADVVGNVNGYFEFIPSVAMGNASNG